MKPIIEIKNISKKYNISHQQGEYIALRDVLTNVMKNPLSFLKTKVKTTIGKAGKEEFWALKDINFTVNKGEVIGIIGHNGAGKSTLLKILSQITPPTTGEIVIHGKIASLLEVGTGFHPELSGRENIFLNGAILGMTKEEIEIKFDQIVEFSGIKQFIDTPVKRYSSGMHVRLAFSVAAHMEPDILLVDEVLAVGDAEFQKKCLGKMDEVTRELGRTIIFVSHDMKAIQKLCKKCVLLKGGKIKMIGETKKVINEYLNIKDKLSNTPLDNRIDRIGKGDVKFTNIKITGKNKSDNIRIGDDIFIYLNIENFHERDINARIALTIRTPEEIGLISCDSLLLGKEYKIHAFSKKQLICKLYSPPLNTGEYFVNIAIFNGKETEDWIISAIKFSMSGETTTNQFPILAKFKWEINS